MILSEKIVALRKRLDWSQEELAEKLDVSRQSVSKWEVGASIPDLDKILKLSELFGVSTDYLLKDEIEDAGIPGMKDMPEGRMVSVEEADSYMNLSKDVSWKMAGAVSLFILSPICMLQLMAFSEAGRMSEDMAMGIGMVVLLIIVAIGVAITIYQGLQLSKYEYLEKETFSLQYGVEGIVEKRKSEFEARFRLNIVAGVVLCIVGAIPLFMTTAFSEENETAAITCINILLLFVSVGVNCFVRAGMVQNSFEKLLQIGDFSGENKVAEGKISCFSGIYWLIVTAAYLGSSFYMERWDKTWIIWPVAGVIYAAVHEILKVIVKNGKDRKKNNTDGTDVII